MKVAVIPARGGSKRIPRKNIKPFLGKPIIGWSIEAAQSSGCFDRIIVSTDDEEIASIANKFGAETPFFRPASLSDDFTGTIPVVRHTIEWLTEHSNTPELACCIYATAPFVQGSDLKNGLEILHRSTGDFAVSVTSFPFPIQRALKINEHVRTEMFYPEHFLSRSQDLPEAFHDAGQFYWGKAKAWLSEEILFEKNTIPIILPRHRVQDIDTQEDWIRAEALFKVLM